MENKDHYEGLNYDLWNCCKGGWKNRVLRWILGAIILIIVFCFGFKLGKYSTFFSERYFETGYYGSSMMGENYYRNMMYPGNYYGNYGYGQNSYGQMGPWMMQGWNQQQPTTLPR